MCMRDRGGEDQQVRNALDLDQVALGHHQPVADRTQVPHQDDCLAGRSVGDSSACSAAWPVSERNTSSSVGRRRPTSSKAIWAVSNLRKASVSTTAPPLTGITNECRWSSAITLPTPSGPSSAPAVASWDTSLTVISRRSPPTCALSWSAVPVSYTHLRA